MKNKLSSCSTISFIIPIRSRSSDLPGGLRLPQIILRLRLSSKSCPSSYLMDASASYSTFDASNAQHHPPRTQRIGHGASRMTLTPFAVGCMPMCATRSRMSSCDDYANKTSPVVLPTCSYESVRRWQQRGAKPLGQCSLYCVHQRGQELGVSGMANESELPINVVNADKPKMLRGLNQKVSGQVQRLQRPLT